MGSAASDRLARKACVDAVKQKVDAVLNAAEGVGRMFAGDLGGLEQVSLELRDALDEQLAAIMGNAQEHPWQAYMLEQAAAGTLLSSAADPLPWFYVTHGGQCFKGRITVRRKDRNEMARFTGFLLGLPETRDRNGLSVQTLKQWELALRDQGMDGIQPLMKNLIAGFEGSFGGETPATAPAGKLDPATSRAVFSMARMKPSVARKIISSSKPSPGAAVIAAVVAAVLFFA